MTKNLKESKKSTLTAFLGRLSAGVRARIANKSAEEFRRLSPAELARVGLPPKSERFVEKSSKAVKKTTPTISKRQYAQKKLSEQAGRRVTLEQRGREYLTGARQASTAAQARMRAIALDSASLRKRYPGERASRVREHMRNMELKERGDYLERDVYLREKAFSEAHLEMPSERSHYQKWFNYGHTKRTSSGHSRHRS